MLKNLSFGLCAVIVVVLMAATIVEKACGAPVAMSYIYTAPWTVAIWAVMACCGLIYVCRCVKFRAPATLLIHAAFAVILLGALVTHCFSSQGTVELATGTRAVNGYLLDNKHVAHFPFELKLKDCRTIFYPGTTAGMDYVSDIEIIAPDGTCTEGTVSMNNIFKHQGYRFYQTAIAPQRSTLSVAYDPWGIGITYTGYALLLIGFVAFFFQKRTRLRALLARLRGTMAVAMLALGLFTFTQQAKAAADETPVTLQRGLAKSYGRLYVYWEDRVCPLQTLAADFCTKLYGHNGYKGLTAEQVLTGWIFDYDVWKDEPMISVKGDRVKQLLGIEGKYAALSDFYGPTGYKLEAALHEGNDANVRAADEKAKLISLVCTGKIIKIYPYKTADGHIEWMSWVDSRPADMPMDDWKFILGSMEYVAREIKHGRNIQANEALLKIREQQELMAGMENLPSPTRFEAEIIYNNYKPGLMAALVPLILGIGVFALFCRSLVNGRSLSRRVCLPTDIIAAVCFVYLLAFIALRGYVSQHWPMSNGFETMQCMAGFSLLLMFVLKRRLSFVRPFGLIVCGLALMVSMIGQSNPPITQLMPVLASPLLSVHVMVIMLAYSLLAFTMLGAAAACIVRRSGMPVPQRDATLTRLADASHLLLYPAVFLLAIGIFIGAVWANQSWGRYWGWDAKETWALVTLLIYAFPLHDGSFPALRRPMVFHTYMLVAFLTVLMTYFGVNYFLTGLHSYAG